jgi:hypothetical protein
MTPTPKLRFVERFEIIEQRPNGLSTGRTVRILQQWWEDHNKVNHVTKSGDDPWVNHYLGEWRDVQIEKEQT